MRLNTSICRSLSTSISDAPAVWTHSGNTAILALNRPKILNPLTVETCLDVKLKLIEWRKSSDVSCFIVKGSGKAFCAGGDIKALFQALCDADSSTVGTGTPGTVEGDFFRQEYELNYMLGVSKVPQVSLWDGIVMGGGVGLSVFGDFRVSTENSLFAMPECSIGIFPDVGSSSWLPKLKVPGMGMYLGLTGSRLGASDLMRTGLATHFVSSDRLMDLETEIVRSCPAPGQDDLNRTLARKALSDILNHFHATNPSQPDESRSILKSEADIIGRTFSKQPSCEAILSALETEQQSSAQSQEWITKTLVQLRKQPPTSLKVTHALLVLAEQTLDLDLKRCLEAEYRLMMRCMIGPNFKEGIRAALIDKDGAPVWSPRTLGEVSDEDVQRYFQSLGQHELDLGQYAV